MPGTDWASEIGGWPVRPKSRPKPRQPEPPPPPPPPPRPRYRRSIRRRNTGAWKVAYGDFVTALMSLFIVLWMMNSSTRIRDAVSGYFHDPKAYARRQAAPRTAAPPAAAAPATERAATDLERRLEDALRRLPDFERLRDHIQVSVTGEGLRIDLLETEQGMFFLTGSPTPTPAGERLLAGLAAELTRMGNSIVIEGHTDARPYRGAGPSTGYGNWELSADRANAARRLLHANGVPPGQVVEVRGFADRQLMRPKTPDDPRNRRISIVVRF